VQVRIVLGCFDRWIIVNADDPRLAWSGNSWVPHVEGISAVAQVSNFKALVDAVMEADRAGFEIDLFIRA
jgi:hypothetical protein